MKESKLKLKSEYSQVNKMLKSKMILKDNDSLNASSLILNDNNLDSLIFNQEK